MNQTPQVSPQVYVGSMREEMAQFAKQIMKAANQAPDGEWIAGSEEKVRDITAEMRRRLFEQAVQKRTDAAEAAFSPSAPSDDGKTVGG